MQAHRFALIAVSVLAACGSDDQTADTAGSALASGNLSGVTTGVNHPSTKAEIWFFFPLMRNKSDDPLQVTGFDVAQVSKYVKVVGYTTFKLGTPNFEDDIPTSWQTDHLFAPDPPGYDLREQKYRSHLPLTIRPAATANAVGVVRVRVSGTKLAQRAVRTTKEVNVSGCIIHYRQDGRPRSQALACHFALGPQRS